MNTTYGFQRANGRIHKCKSLADALRIAATSRNLKVVMESSTGWIDYEPDAEANDAAYGAIYREAYLHDQKTIAQLSQEVARLRQENSSLRTERDRLHSDLYMEKGYYRGV